MGNLILCWIPLQPTRLFWIDPSFAPWARSTSMTPLHLWQRATRVNIKGFSAGSYVGLALVHAQRDIKSVRTCSVLGAIACPPLFLKVPDDRHTVHLIHYVPDKLCRWNPGQPFLDMLKCKYTIVHGHFDLHQHHFGKDEHNYSIGWACNWKEEFSLCPIS